MFDLSVFGVPALRVGITGQLLHPASVSAVDHPAAHIQEVAASPVWVLSHTLPSFIALGPAALGFWVPLMVCGVRLWRQTGAAVSQPGLAG